MGEAADLTAPPRSMGPRRLAIRRFRRHRLAAVGTVALAAIIAIALFLPVLTDMDPLKTDLRAISQPPSLEHPLGTDRSGRDVLARVVYGARTSLVVGLGAVSLYLVIGTILGAMAGMLGGTVDHLVMRTTDTLMSIPTLLLIIVFVSAIGPSLMSVVLVIGLLGWPGTCRLVRGQVLALREAEFVVAARVVGAGDSQVLRWHLLPNLVSPLVVVATFGIANAIVIEASLGFLGLGVRPPTPSWGEMINAAQSPTVLVGMPWLWLAPGVAIMITVLAVNFIGDGLRDALDPRSTGRSSA